MTLTDIIHFIGYSAPLISSIICGIILVLCFNRKNRPSDPRLLKLLILYFFIVPVNWMSVIFFDFMPVVSVYCNALYYFLLPLAAIVFYHFVYILTNTGKDKQFPIIQYVILLVCATGLSIWTFTIPFDVQLHITEYPGNIVPGYEAFSKFTIARLPIRCIYNIAYILFGIHRLFRYRKAVLDYSADISRSSLQWLNIFLVLLLAQIPLPLTVLLFVDNNILTIVLAILPIILLTPQHVILCYNMLTGNYVIMDLSETNGDNNLFNEQQKFGLNKKRFEQYIHEKKPYINPKLKITDLTLALHTNRTYLSVFINTTYNMNFSRYINRCRLEELARLRTNPAYKKHSELELMFKAGFSNYRGYQRIRKTEEIRPFKSK